MVMKRRRKKAQKAQLFGRTIKCVADDDDACKDALMARAQEEHHQARGALIVIREVIDKARPHWCSDRLH